MVPSLIIFVDEMDKIENAKDRQTAINHLKDLFRIPHVKFVTTVAEENYQRFMLRRYGLPKYERDPYDSAFDSIIHLKPMDPLTSVHLFTRRVTGFPTPLGLLVYCLTNGHPRDMIRLARKALDYFRDAVGDETGLDTAEKAERRNLGLEKAITWVCDEEVEEFADVVNRVFDEWHIVEAERLETGLLMADGTPVTVGSDLVRTSFRKAELVDAMKETLEKISGFVIEYVRTNGWAEPKVDEAQVGKSVGLTDRPKERWECSQDCMTAAGLAEGRVEIITELREYAQKAEAEKRSAKE
jgi:hypothetical protein